MLETATQFALLGFDVAQAGHNISITIESGNFETLLINIEFRRYYAEEIFKLFPLPDGFTYIHYLQFGEDGCSRILHTDNYLVFAGANTAKDAVKLVIGSLTAWAYRLEEHIEVLKLSGLLPY